MYKREETENKNRHPTNDYQVLIGLVIVAVAIVIAAYIVRHFRYVAVEDRKVGPDFNKTLFHKIFDSQTGCFKE